MEEPGFNVVAQLYLTLESAHSHSTPLPLGPQLWSGYQDRGISKSQLTTMGEQIGPGQQKGTEFTYQNWDHNSLSLGTAWSWVQSSGQGRLPISYCRSGFICTVVLPKGRPWVSPGKKQIQMPAPVPHWNLFGVVLILGMGILNGSIGIPNM